MHHTRCVLHKVNADTHGALASIARRARLEQSALCIAGTKDKRGVTSQWLSAFKVSPVLLSETARRDEVVTVQCLGVSVP
jgi:tRNA(Glu) U13 pseudouridine synthase TruD